jgi:hypothetical protein
MPRFKITWYDGQRSAGYAGYGHPPDMPPLIPVYELVATDEDDATTQAIEADFSSKLEARYPDAQVYVDAVEDPK